MFSRTKEYSCFIIGPMGDSHLNERARLRKLQDRVVRPILNRVAQAEGVTYTVRTPYDLGGNHIMNDVIYAIDRAHIVVADLTGFNPNVFYELALSHALGRPTISVIEDTREKQPDGSMSKMSFPFDISAYKYYLVNLDEDQFTEARDALQEPLERAHREADWRMLENPVIDFFRAPITFISPAFTLAENYYLNFVKPVVESIIRRDGQTYQYAIVTGTKAHPNPTKPEEAESMPVETRRKLKVHVVVPAHVELTRRNYADRLKGVPNLYTAFVGSSGRPFTSFMRVYDGESKFELVDIPTTIRGMESAVERRLRHQVLNHDDPKYREIEMQEIERFVVALESFIARHEFGEEFRKRVKITVYDPNSPGDMLWLHNLIAADDE